MLRFTAVVLATSCLLAPDAALAQATAPTAAQAGAGAPAATTDYSQLIGHDVLVTWNGGSMTGRLLAVDPVCATVLGRDGQTRLIGFAGITSLTLSPHDPAASSPPAATVDPPQGLERYPAHYGRGGIIAGSILMGSGVAVFTGAMLFADVGCDDATTDGAPISTDDDTREDCQRENRMGAVVIGGGLVGGGLIPLLIGINRRKYAGRAVVAEETEPNRGNRALRPRIVRAETGPTRHGWAAGLTVSF